jgi:hypothetical protein
MSLPGGGDVDRFGSKKKCKNVPVLKIEHYVMQTCVGVDVQFTICYLCTEWI